MKATRVPSDTWTRKVCTGTDENGEKVYETLYGKSEEEVNEKARALQRKKQFERQGKWQSENMDRVSVVFNKGVKDRIKASGIALNKFVRDAVEKELQARGL